MSQPKIIVVCEDKQQETFIRRFFKKRNLRIHAVSRPSGGAGDQFVREAFPAQLDAVRKRGGTLVAMIDADKSDVAQRQQQMDEACKRRDIRPRVPGDNAAVLVPRRNIETWFAYLDGEQVDETCRYDRLKNENECSRHVDELWEMCTRRQRLRTPSPVSLEAACREYKNLRL